ncbi:MAG: AMP-binding protein [Pseudomonadales bacterium]
MTDPGSGDKKDNAARLLELIRGLVDELGTSRNNLPIDLDASFERDLGFDSLARVELIARVEEHFGVALAEKVFAEVETPRDLLRALASAGGPRTISSEPAKHVALGEAEAAPRSAETLVEVLDWHVQAHGDRRHLQFYTDAGDGESLTFRDLRAGAETIAAGLQQRGIKPGETVALILPTGKDYFFSFFGVLLARAVPVPIYPPVRASQIEDHLRRHTAILNNCEARLLIADPDTTQVAHWLRSVVTSMQAVVTTADLMTGARYQPMPASPQDTAFLQYTSGSTGQPKGVVLSHANLLANIRAMGEWIDAGPEDVFVSWLPLYHDMGLIGAWLGSLYYATFFLVMSPMSFLAAPHRWLWAIHRYGGTLSAAPNFGYELCLHRVRNEQIEGLDLRSWRAAFNGAEAVSPTTLERFCERFGTHGFERAAMMPVYGLAENSVGLAFPPLGREPLIDCIERRTFAQTGNAVPAPSNAETIRFPACGHPLKDHQIRVVDDTGRELPDREQGRIEFKGPSATSRYYRNPQKTRELFDGEWLDSGDLGYTVDGELYVTGRIKDVVIRAGRNIYPQELEEAVGELKGIRKGRVAVFGSMDPQSATEKLVIVAETRETDEDARSTMRASINELAMDQLEAPPDDIVLAPPGSLLKTSSGKMRRTAIRERYEKGEATRPPPPVWRQWLSVQLMRLMPSIRRANRHLDASLYAAWVWTWYGLLAPLVWLGLMVLPSLRWRWGFLHRLARLFAGLTATPIKVEGGENLPDTAPCVLVVNHQSYLDPYVLMYVLKRPASFVAKVELAHKRSTGPPLRRLGCAFVERFDTAKGSEDARVLTDAARAGRSLVFFPEGTFTRIPGLRTFHMGAFMTAADADLPVVPIAIRGTRSMLRADSWFPRRGRISVRIGEPVSPGDLREPGESAWQTALKLRDRARATIVAASGEPDLVGRRSAAVRW